ncbi:tyrosine-type recombinase/integrase [Microbaculum marinisediminis]|uniref:Integrase arm-type DNA-binding domain-containing protein n=1 Tax=Microbaculum marinisediminis TaxID=2931392 RepID=A0AAW5R195_9HYPH|nr:site-specific integrase [Microbaculum sp. A6E488]MCT8972481.1 integrase arm-type DNA-binding domain-containing protein [Microbaculum sp. A6E488]
MKPKGRHPEKALNPARIRATTQPGRYADGNGLYLVVAPSGAKRWVLRTVVHGRRRDIGLGGLQLVSLSEAREQAVQLRKLARDGGDPLAEKRKVRTVVPTFAEAAVIVHADHKSAWRNSKHADQWINTLRDYAFPYIGDRRVDHIDTPEVLRVLSPIWLTKPETARRVRQRIGTVLDWAKAAGFRSEGNPVEGVSKGLPRQPDRKSHHAAMPYADVPEFVSRLREGGTSEINRLAFEFLILTAARTSEVLKAEWTEFDIEGALWTVPAARMKAKREHRVPLSARAVTVLKRAQELSGDSRFVFAGRSSDKPLSNMAFLMVLRRMNLPVTAHGFRSAFSDWSAERTNFPREVCEMALAHTVKNKAEAAYRRGDLLEKRRELMATWEAFLSSETSNIVPLRIG